VNTNITYFSSVTQHFLIFYNTHNINRFVSFNMTVYCSYIS